MTVMNLVTSQSFEDFKATMRTDFTAFHHGRRERDKLRKPVPYSILSKYVKEFRIIVLTILGMNDDENLDKFCAVLKRQGSSEVFKSGPHIVDVTTRIALNVHSALFVARLFS